MEVYIFVPCFLDQLYPTVAWNMVQVLEYLGFKVIQSKLPACCGQAPHNAGFSREANKILCNFWQYYEDFDAKIIIPSSSCASFLISQTSQSVNKVPSKFVEKSFSKRIFEFSDFLETHSDISKYNFSYPFKVALHKSCSSLREYPQINSTQSLLTKVSNLNILTIPQTESCCGFGGSFAMKFGAISNSMASQKLKHIQSTGTNKLVSSDPSCLIHLYGYAKKHQIPLEILHPADILAFSINQS